MTIDLPSFLLGVGAGMAGVIVIFAVLYLLNQYLTKG